MAGVRRHHTFPLNTGPAGGAICLDRPPQVEVVKHQKEVCMELKLSLNMLAAVSSFAFLAAVVLGMF